jgi:phosphate-selective porin
MEDRRIPKKILTYNTKTRWNLGSPKLSWRDKHALQEDGTVQHGLFLHDYDDDDNNDDDDDDDVSGSNCCDLTFMCNNSSTILHIR